MIKKQKIGFGRRFRPLNEFLKKVPTLSGKEKIIGKAGEGMDDPWQSEPSHGFLSKNLTPAYREFLKKIHMVDAKPVGEKVLPSDEIERLNMEWRKLQDSKKKVNEEASRRIKNFDSYDEREVQKLIKEKKAVT